MPELMENVFDLIETEVESVFVHAVHYVSHRFLVLQLTAAELSECRDLALVEFGWPGEHIQVDSPFAFDINFKKHRALFIFGFSYEVNREGEPQILAKCFPDYLATLWV